MNRVLESIHLCLLILESLAAGGNLLAAWKRCVEHRAELARRIGAQERPHELVCLRKQVGLAREIGQCVAAADAFTRALVVDPANLDAQVGLGVVALMQGRPDHALATWHGIIDLDPEHVNARMLIANLYRMQALGESHTDLADLLEAERWYLEVIALDPTNVAAHDGIADLAQLRAQVAMLDSTAPDRSRSDSPRVRSSSAASAAAKSRVS